MFKLLRRNISHEILIKLHIALWILFGIYSVFDTLWNCTEWEILPYLFMVWIFLFLAFYFSYGYFASRFFVQKEYLKSILGLLIVLLVVNFIYTEIQYIIPLDICNDLGEPDETPDRVFYWMNVILNLKTTSVIILLAFGLYYLEYSKSEELKQKLAHIDYLKNQISPHYLLNALNDLMYTAVASPDKIKEEIEELSEWLIFSLYKIDKELITIDEEVKHIQLFLRRLSTYINDERKIEAFVNFNDLPLHIRNIKIPPLILFNLVENSVKFSQITHEIDAQIKISLNVKDNFFHFVFENTISDNYFPKKNSNGLGLSNIKDRLRLKYGKNYIFLTKKANSIFTIEISIPYET